MKEQIHNALRKITIVVIIVLLTGTTVFAQSEALQTDSSPPTSVETQETPSVSPESTALPVEEETPSPSAEPTATPSSEPSASPASSPMATENNEPEPLSEDAEIETQAASENGYSYTVKNGAASITGYTGTGGVIRLPETLGGYPVTSIAGNGFRGNTNITRVIIPGCIKTIERLDYTSIQSITLEEGVEVIDECAFLGSNLLTEINIPSSLKIIGAYAFYGNPNNIDAIVPDDWHQEGDSTYVKADSIVITTHRYYDTAREVITLINAERQKRGLPSLTITKNLMEAGMTRASECDLIFDHTRPTSLDCDTYGTDISLENLGSGNLTASQMVDAWMDSGFHRNAILDSDINYIGVGVTKPDGGYMTFVAEFGMYSDSGLGNGSTEPDADVDQTTYYLSDFCPVTLTLSGLSNMNVGETKNATATAKSTVKNPNFTYKAKATWTSSNPGVATVDSAGKVKALAAGSTTITATSGTTTASQTITVNRAAVAMTGLSVTPSTLTFTQKKASQLTATKLPGNTTNTSGITWKSANTGIATVSSTGLVTPIANGQTTITASCEGKTAVCTIKVNYPVPLTGLTMNKSSVTIGKTESYQLSAQKQPTDTTNKTSIAWSSSNSGIVSVGGNGLITGKAEGSATITATCSGKSTSCKVTVTKTVSTPHVSYNTHVQNVGWQGYVKDGATAGTSGRSLRLEGIHISVSGVSGLGIQYRTHVQNIGWQGWSSNGAMSGTSGKSYRLEAIQMALTGVNAANYDVYYRVHAQNVGWLTWAKNGQAAGTEGMSYRLEAIQIRLVKKGNAAPGSTANAFRQR